MQFIVVSDKCEGLGPWVDKETLQRHQRFSMIPQTFLRLLSQGNIVEAKNVFPRISNIFFYFRLRFLFWKRFLVRPAEKCFLVSGLEFPVYTNLHRS